MVLIDITSHLSKETCVNNRGSLTACYIFSVNAYVPSKTNKEFLEWAATVAHWLAQ